MINEPQELIKAYALLRETSPNSLVNMQPLSPIEVDQLPDRVPLTIPIPPRAQIGPNGGGGGGNLLTVRSIVLVNGAELRYADIPMTLGDLV